MKKGYLTMVCVLLLSNTMTVFAQTNGYGAGQGRTDTVNINDYSTSVWDRFTYNYQFETNVDYSKILGTPTTTDIIARKEGTENIRRNKDVAYMPPSYGVFSAQIDTDRSNPYIIPDSAVYTRSANLENYPLGVDLTSVSEAGILPNTSLMYDNSRTSSGNSVTISNEVLTDALYYSDGSIGRLKISEIDLDIKVYEGETEENMKRGAAHFEFTSNWDGTIGLAGVRPDRALLKVV